MPAGSLAPTPGRVDSMDVDEPAKKPVALQEEDEPKPKKRKVEGSSKKSKKEKSTK